MGDTGISASGHDDAGRRDLIERAPEHPSAPLPEVGPSLGSGARVALGNTGIGAFPFVLGTSEFATTIGPRPAVSVLDRYIELGGNAVHTDAAAGEGAADEQVGTWMGVRGIRDDLVILARVGGHPDERIGRSGLAVAVERTLRRLGTERIDVLFLDGAADPSIGAQLESVLGQAEGLRERGMIGTIGAHGLDTTELVQARILASSGYPLIEVADVPYGLTERDVYEREMRHVTVPQGIAVTPTHAVPRRYLARDTARGGILGLAWRSRTSRVVERISAEMGIPTAAVAFAWTAAQEGIAAPIVDVFAPRHVEEVVRGVGAHLGRAQLSALSSR